MVTRRLPPNPVVVVRPVDPIRPIDLMPGPVVVPGLLNPAHTTSLFDRSRRGKPVARPDDLAALRVELINLDIIPGSPPMVRTAASGKAFVVLHFAPQALGEQAFFQAAPPSKAGGAPDEVVDTPKGAQAGDTGTNGVEPPPVLARIAGESRLAFAVPAGFEAPYTLAGMLAACEALVPSVPASALARQRPVPDWRWPLIVSARELAALPARQRASLSRLTVRLQRAPTISPGLLARQQLAGWLGVAGGSLSGAVGPVERLPRLPRIPPRPADPTATQTAIEMPWRLVLAPHTAERFRHAAQPVVSPATQRIELWHTRMVLPDSKGAVAPAPQPDAQRTVRAVWARTDDTRTQMQSAFPAGADLPPPSDLPFRATMDDNDRFQIAHLSSNFSVPDYQPQPIQADRLMLSALGGWLDARGAWEPPGLDVEEWVNHATMGRDHYVRVVYRGLFVCFGHRVSLVKVTERKFHNGRNGTSVEPGNAAYLRQRLFIVVREQERSYVEPGLLDGDGRVLHNQFPFTRIRLLTTITPDLDPPDSAPSRIAGFGDRRMFWPCVGGQPFRFDCMGEDLEGRQVTFSLPLIFMINSLASPRTVTSKGFSPHYAKAEEHALAAAKEWLSRNDSVNGRTVPRRRAPLGGQQVAFAPALQAGDTSAAVETLDFGIRAKGSAVNGNVDLKNYSEELTRPVFFPSVLIARVRLPAVAHLAGGGGSSVLSYNEHYLKKAYADNPGEVFMEIDAVADPNPPADARLAPLDFSKQTDRAGGFVMPNLQPSGWSRMAGPVSGGADDFRKGDFNPGSAFPSAEGSLGSLPLPLIFGCIPLGAVIEAVDDFAGGAGKLPKFVAEGASKVESFINELTRLYDVVRRLANDPAHIATAVVAVAQDTLDDLAKQALAFAAAQAAPVTAAITQAHHALDQLALAVAPLKGVDINAAPALPALPAAAAQVQAALGQLGHAVDDASGLPAGFRQAVRTVEAQADRLLLDVLALPPLLTAAQQLYAALDDVVGNHEDLGALLSDPDVLGARLEVVQQKVDGFRTALAGTRLLDGAPRKAVLQVLDAVSSALGLAADLMKLLEQLTGEELVIRFDWKPEIKSWGFDPASPIFRVNDIHGFVIAVEARVKRSGGAPKVSVLCGLNHFDLVLIAPASFIELNFEKIEFTVDSNAKMDVDVVLSGIKFVGPLSFVETLRDLIPLDGFSDPPALEISERGIDASFSVGLPAIAVGMFNLSNLSLGAGFTVPFIGQPLAVRFNFCTREQPFNLTVMAFGGGGFFGITIDPHGVQILEASFEFGASLSVNFGVASGGVHIMAGLYYRMENNLSSLTGYFRLGGHVSVLGLISASIELYLELSYVPDTGKCKGKAQLTIEVSVFLFSGSVTITCERTFAGANGDPTFRQAMGPQPALALVDELAAIEDDTRFAWRDYCEAFA